MAYNNHFVWFCKEVESGKNLEEKKNHQKSEKLTNN